VNNLYKITTKNESWDNTNYQIKPEVKPSAPEMLASPAPFITPVVKSFTFQS